MELIYAIADCLDIPNEYISIDSVVGNIVWFSTKSGARYTCQTARNGKYLKKHSIRVDTWK